MIGRRSDSEAAARLGQQRWRLRIVALSAGAFMARVRRMTVSPSAAHGTPGGGSALTSGPGAERESDKWDP
jgi:hypothetical protein